jgi:diguanylate cyclase
MASRRAGPAIWWILGLLIVFEAAQEVLGGLGPDALFQDWIHDAVLVAATALCLWRALQVTDARGAWLAIGAGLACWTAGTLLWSVLYGGDLRPPYPTLADVWWLLWYPCMAIGISLLLRRRAHRFELHRWMDGLAVALIVMTWGTALFVQPIVQDRNEDALASIVTFAYPILDILLIGGILGLFGLMGWRPGRTWLLLGVGCVIIAGGDAVYAVQFGQHLQLDHDYDFIWTLGAVLIALAAYGPPARVLDHHPVVGWRVIVLPLMAQALAASIQVYSLLGGDLGGSERVLTLVVLAIASVQIIVARPRELEP